MLEIYANLGNTLNALQNALKIAIGNADNFNSPGYKYVSPSFTTVYQETLRDAGPNTNPVQRGASMTLGHTTTDYSQGSVSGGGPLDAAIVGEGFFMLSRSSYDYGIGSPKAFTRAGNFMIDNANHFLVDSSARKVFGYKVNADGTIDRNLTPISTDGQRDVGFIENGILVGNFSARKNALASKDPNPPAHIPLYQLALTSFDNKQGLVPFDGSANVPTEASGREFLPGISEERGYGKVQGESLEGSNIDVAKVALDMNQLSRGFAAVQGVIDDVNRTISNLLQAFTS